MKKAIATLIDDHSFLYWKVFFKSFLNNNSWFINNPDYDFILIEPELNTLSNDKKNFIRNNINNVKFIQSKISNNIKPIYDDFFKSWISIVVFNKFEIFNLIKDYDRIVFFDGDILCMNSIEELFNQNYIEDMCICKEYKEYTEITSLDDDLSELNYSYGNTGFFILNHNTTTININIEQEIKNILNLDINELNKFKNVYGGEFGSFQEQDVLNALININNLTIKYLPIKYNAFNFLFDWNKFNYKEASIIHLCTLKPWMNYGLIEWCKYYNDLEID